MKAFSPAGAATKAFYGRGAFTFGNPAGHTSGGGGTAPAGTGPGNTTPQLARHDAGLFPGDPVQLVAISDGASDALVTTSSGAAAYTSSGGSIWTRVAPPLVAGITGGFFQIAAKPGGIYVIAALTPGSPGTPKLIASTNNGHTWTDVTPVGATPTLNVVYSPLVGLFINFDGANTNVYTSPDAVTWTTTAGQPPAAGNAHNGFLLADNGSSVLVAQVLPSAQPLQFWSSTDGQHWTPRLLLSSSFGIFTSQLSFIWAGSFFATVVGDGTHLFVYVSTDGVNWSLQSGNGGDLNNVAPFSSFVAFMVGQLLSGVAESNFLDFAQSANQGVSWQRLSIASQLPSTASGQTGFLTDLTHNVLYSFGQGIQQSINLFNWSSIVDPSNTVNAMAVHNISESLHMLAVGSDVSGNGAIWRGYPND